MFVKHNRFILSLKHHAIVQDNHHRIRVHFPQNSTGGSIGCWMTWEHEQDESDDRNGSCNKFILFLSRRNKRSDLTS